MGKIVIELTNRCNLSCQHCFTGRHGGDSDLPLEVLQEILDNARNQGFEHLCFTGGDPTVHANFPEVIRRTHAAGYKFSFNTNGWNFPIVYPKLLPYVDRLSVVTFSVDGATEATHDQQRGEGSYRRVLKAISICMIEGIPFTINMVITGQNRHEIDEMGLVATQLGARGLRFSHLMHSPITTLKGFDLTTQERKVVEAEVWNLRNKYPIRIDMGPGYFTTSLFPCAALSLLEINVDCQGNLTKCCHLSGHGDEAGKDDIGGNLAEIGFAAAYARIAAENEEFHQAKLEYLGGGKFQDADFFPCWFCSLYYDKLGWLKKFKRHSWAPLMWDRATAGNPTSTQADAANTLVIPLKEIR